MSLDYAFLGERDREEGPEDLDGQDDEVGGQEPGPLKVLVLKDRRRASFGWAL